MIRVFKSRLVAVILAAVASAAVAQAVAPHQIKSAYLIRFFDYITWEREADIGTFRIGVVGEDAAIFGELTNAAKTVKAKGKPISVARPQALAEMPEFEMLFVTRNAPFSVREIAAATRRTNTLLVTDGSDARRDFMINLVERKDQTIGFEVNRSNIVFERLKIDIGILVLGGTELDVAELVKETESEMAQTKEQLTTREQELQGLQKDVAAQTQKLGQQTAVIARQTADIEAREAELATLQEQMQKAAEALASNQSKVDESQRELDEKLAEIDRLSKSIGENTALLDQQRRELESKDSTLTEQSRSLQKQDVTIAVQRTGLVLAVLALLVFVILTGIILYIANDRRKVNARLSEAKETAERASAIANTTLQNMGQGILMADAQGHILVYNDQLMDYLGIDRQAAAACRTVHELVELGRDQVGEAATRRAQELAREGGRASYELAAKGKILDVRQIPLAEGGFVRTYTDISARKQVEERISTVVEAAPSGMIMVDGEGRMVMVNSEAERVFGYKREQMIGQGIEMLVPHAFRTGHPQLRDEFFRKPESRFLRARVLVGQRADGTEFPLEIGLNPIRISEGLFILASVVDITERKRAEEELKQSEERLALAMQAGRFTPWEADLKSGKTQTFSFFEKVLRYAPGELEDTLESWKAVVHPDDLGPFGAAFGRFLEGGSGTFRFQYRAYDKQKRERWVEAVGTVVGRDATGRPERVIGTQQDVTERRETELLAQERMRELEEFNRVAVGRELRMIELKKHINELLAGLGRDTQYEIIE